MKKNIMVIVSGFSGAGKGTVLSIMKEKYGNYWTSVSWTTRAPRKNEIAGVHYHYKTVEEFEALVAEDGFLEHAGYADHYYGTPKKPIEDALANGMDVILEIEIQGAMQIKEKYPEIPTIFISVKDRDTLEARLRNRKTEKEEEIEKRLKRASIEVKELDKYEYILINDIAETCAEELHALIQAEKARVAYHEDHIREIQASFAG